MKKSAPKVSIIATFGEDSVLMIKGTRTGLPDPWYLPKGTVRPSDGKPVKAAQRILRQATGIRVRVSQLAEIDPAMKPIQDRNIHSFRVRIEDSQIAWLGSRIDSVIAATRTFTHIGDNPREYGCNVIKRLRAVRLIPPYEPPSKKIAPVVSPRTYDHYCPSCSRSTTSTEQRDSCGACGGATAP